MTVAALPLGKPGRDLRVSLLGGFCFSIDGEPLLAMSEGSKRLVAFLALQPGAITRPAVAGTLWPDATNERAHASLRSALSRMSPAQRGGVRVGPHELSLAGGVAVDSRDWQLLARHLLDPEEEPWGNQTTVAAVAAFSCDLLPGWYDEWALLAAETWRQLRLHALEALAARLMEAGLFGEASLAALAAIQAEPLRESAHACLVRVHLAEGNQSEALAAYGSYCRLLKAELGLQPTAHLTDLVAHLAS